MAEDARALEEHIAEKRREIGRDLDELQNVMTNRVERMTDWRRILRSNRLAAVGVASVAGLMLGWFTSGLYG